MAGTSLKESNANFEMTKTLLDYVDRLGSNTNFWFGADRGRGRSRGRGQRERKIGSSNIRNMASMAVNAECYKEFRLFIEYKKVKATAGMTILKMARFWRCFAGIWMRYIKSVTMMTMKP